MPTGEFGAWRAETRGAQPITLGRSTRGKQARPARQRSVSLRLSRLLGHICCVLFVLCGRSQLHAQLLPADNAAAQALMDEARRLVDQRHYATACVKLEESLALVAAAGTMLQLADCYEKTGRTASAWAAYRDSAAAARRANDAEQERLARERAKELQPQLSYLTVITWKGQDVAIARDGVKLDSALIGTALPVDPGAHEIVASAPGKRSWAAKVNVKPHSDRISVSVPILAEDPNASAQRPAVAPPTAAAEASTDSDYPEPVESRGGLQRAFAIVAAAIGVAGAATGTVFGLKAGSTMNQAKAQCAAAGLKYPNCNDSSVRLSEEALQSGQISTVSFIAGGTGIAVFALLWLTAPSPEASPVSVALGPLALDLHGRF